MQVSFFMKTIFMSFLLGGLITSAQANQASAISELYQRLESMGKEIDELRGENETLRKGLGDLRQSQKQTFLALDERIKKQASAKATAAPQARAAIPARPPVKKEPVKPAPVAAQKPATPTKVNVKADYNQAYATLKRDHGIGIKAFENFLKKYPTDPLAENAHYWIGEAKYSKKDYRGAIDSFIVVLNKYKKGRKAPDAAVKLGYSFYAVKDWNLARRTFNDVLRYFPKSNAAKLAQKRLDQMKAEGH
ncbi:MAG: Unknown protein [uncultured Thiotrichaceae bacterium]|uniref:Cell division coordinator CpoB n=1 Tax=uncultured Thiotrichaceae bacterium TaxID=298394 RepID=A0A6S6TXH6_9GAMM|nr:MAG: Unknown protein [uncultured Thiotrichaceae bacterium]